jgi:hypothetical protein
MYRQRMLLIALSVMASHVSGADPAALLAKVADAFDRNAERERYWTWTSKEIWQIADRTGKVLQQFPSVTIESAIKRDGTRCNAVVAWSDGVPPHLLHADTDSRCDATVSSDSVKFNVTELLKARDVKIASDSPGRIILAIAPDHERARSSDHQVSCAASIRATFLVDPTTFFPRRIEGEVTGDGCDQRSAGAPNLLRRQNGCRHGKRHLPQRIFFLVGVSVAAGQVRRSGSPFLASHSLALRYARRLESRRLIVLLGPRDGIWL